MGSILFYIARILYLALPVIVAGALHMAVVALDLLPWLKWRLDGGRSWRGRRIFGDNKTVRGVVVMIVLCGLGFIGQAWLHSHSEWARSLAFFDYRFPDSFWTPFLAGGVFGLGYVLAELPNSFAKRRLGAEAGKEVSGSLRVPFLLIDQGDSVIGCVLALYVFAAPPWHVIPTTILLGTGLHLLLNWLLYVAGLRKRPV